MEAHGPLRALRGRQRVGHHGDDHEHHCNHQSPEPSHLHCLERKGQWASGPVGAAGNTDYPTGCAAANSSSVTSRPLRVSASTSTFHTPPSLRRTTSNWPYMTCFLPSASTNSLRK